MLAAKLEEAGLADRVEVTSSGTGGWHVGDPMDQRAAATLTAAGYDPSRHRVRKYEPGRRSAYDLVLAMDSTNLADIGGADDRVRLFRDFDPVDPGADVPDPYYGGPAGSRRSCAWSSAPPPAIVAALQGELSLR